MSKNNKDETKGKNQSYSELLRHPKWQMKRLEILQRDGAKCQLCGDEETELHIHHKHYKRGKKPWEYENDSLVTYCKHCHAIVEYYKGAPEVRIFKIGKPKNTKKNFSFTIYFFDGTEDCYAMCVCEYDIGSGAIKPILALRENSVIYAAKALQEQRKIEQS